MGADALFKSLAEYVNTKSLPPVESWHPEHESKIDIRIDASGNWTHEGDPIKRLSMVRLFSSILRKDLDNYFLVTPEVKLGIVVEDVPFLIAHMETTGQGATRELAFVSQVGDYIPLDKAHPLTMEKHLVETRPYLLVRGGMQALLSRPVYYQMAELCTRNSDSDGSLGVWSYGNFFALSE